MRHEAAVRPSGHDPGRMGLGGIKSRIALSPAQATGSAGASLRHWTGWGRRPCDLAETDAVRTQMVAGVEEAFEAQISVGRIGAADDVAAAVALLCSSYASFTTGEVHVMNGGWW